MDFTASGKTAGARRYAAGMSASAMPDGLMRLKRATRLLAGVLVGFGLLAGPAVLSAGTAQAAARAVPASATWTITPGPTSGFGLLRTVYAASASNAWAVGAQSAATGSGRQLLIQHWDGSAWQAVTAPAVSAFSNELYDVSGTSSSDVWAVGDTNTADIHPYPPQASVILHWDGTSWTKVPSPNSTAFTTRLLSVSAFGPDDAWASGITQTNGEQFAGSIVMHWDGSNWTTVSTPDQDMSVEGGSSGSDVWFSGTSGNWHWNGSTFTQVSGPRFSSGKVAAISPTDEWATANSNNNEVLTHWNGSTWSTVTTLAANQDITSLAALSANDVWAVGQQSDANGDRATLTMQWNGSNWTTVSSPNPAGSNFNYLSGAAAAGPGTVLAVGSDEVGSNPEGTLALVTTNG